MRAPLLVFVVLACVAAEGVAQLPGGMPKMSAAEIAEAHAACEQLAGMTNAPMSVQSCKAMLGMAGTAERMQPSAADPAAQRPGDEKLSCEAIFAEMTSLGATLPPQTGAAKAEAAVAEGTALAGRQAAEGTAFIAGSMALGTAMGAASVVMPNFVGAAIAAAWAAQMAGLGTRQVAEQAALRPRRDQALIAVAEDFERTMTEHPRFARLAQLGMDKGCEPPSGAMR